MGTTRHDRPSALRPRGLVDLRGHDGAPLHLGYPAGAVVVVSGLPGSGKSTLLRRWSTAATVVDPRATHLACEALMPAWLPYAAYRPWARTEHLRWTLSEARSGRPVLVHDCGSWSWMRRLLSRTARRDGRELHLVLLDVGPTEALAGQQARGRRARTHVFARHRRGLGRLLHALDRDGATALPEAASVLLLDARSRGRARTVEFGDGRTEPADATTPEPTTADPRTPVGAQPPVGPADEGDRALASP
ncbi:AAA family ATPase [Kitasatospora camelliae]|uniref:AAA family ATPase n=1 Tax=Kitasatospora camelliae TaxID=3156397 RepID=A0AAU8JSV4_9ACTN